MRAQIEALERDHTSGADGRNLGFYFRFNGHVVFPLLAELARSPAILDRVEGVLGPDLLTWSVELFVKEPGDGKPPLGTRILPIGARARRMTRSLRGSRLVTLASRRAA